MHRHVDIKLYHLIDLSCQKLLDSVNHWVVEVVKCLEQEEALARCNGSHSLALVHITGHGLFAQDMFPET